MTSFGWLLDLLPPATPGPTGVAAGVAEDVDAHRRTATAADEASHLPHLPHRENGGTGNDRLDDLAEHLTERAAILEHHGGLNRAAADEAAVRIVQCSTCSNWTSDPLGSGGIGRCSTGADDESASAHDRRAISAWPHAPRYCASWQAVP